MQRDWHHAEELDRCDCNTQSLDGEFESRNELDEHIGKTKSLTWLRRTKEVANTLKDLLVANMQMDLHRFMAS